MKEQLLRLFQLVSLRGGPLTDDARDALEQVLGIICQRNSKEALPQLACDILAQMDWHNPGAKALFSEDGIWAMIPQKNGTEAFIEAMFWQDKLGEQFAGIALGILPLRFVYSRLHEPHAIEVVKRLVNPIDPDVARFRLFGTEDQNGSVSHE